MNNSAQCIPVRTSSTSRLSGGVYSGLAVLLQRRKLWRATAASTISVARSGLWRRGERKICHRLQRTPNAFSEVRRARERLKQNFNVVEINIIDRGILSLQRVHAPDTY